MRTLSIILASMFLTTPLLAAGPADGKTALPGAGHVQCPHCHAYCILDVDKSPDKKSCWEIECKPICIPRVTFPWQYKRCPCGSGKVDGVCCGPKPLNGAKVKYVRSLKKVEYECPKCKYVFTPVCDDCGLGGGKGKGKDAPNGTIPAPPEPTAQHETTPPVRFVERIVP